METLDETCKNIIKNDKDDDYKKIFRYYVENFVNIIQNKKKKSKD